MLRGFCHHSQTGAADPKLAHHNDPCPWGQGTLCLLLDSSGLSGGKNSLRTLGPDPTQRFVSFRRQTSTSSSHRNCFLPRTPWPFQDASRKTFLVFDLGRTAILTYEEEDGRMGSSGGELSVLRRSWPWREDVSTLLRSRWEGSPDLQSLRVVTYCVWQKVLIHPFSNGAVGNQSLARRDKRAIIDRPLISL